MKRDGGDGPTDARLDSTVSDDIKDAAGRFAARFGLSGREAEVLALAAVGRINKEIAGTLGISYRTVIEYWVRICSKTGCPSQTLVLALLLRHVIESS